MLEFDLHRPWYELPMAVVDIETTGLDVFDDRAVEIGIITCKGGEVDEKWFQLVNPECCIPPVAAQIHGIGDEMVESCRTFRELKWEIHHKLRGRLMVAFNGLRFDRPFLAAEMERCGLTLPHQPVLDPMLWALGTLPAFESKPRSLPVVCQYIGIEYRPAHRVEEDCEALLRLTSGLAGRVPQLLGELIEAQEGWASGLDAWLADRKRRREEARRAEAPPSQSVLRLESNEESIDGKE